MAQPNPLGPGVVEVIGPPSGVRVYLAAGVTDMRKGFDELATLVQQRLRQDPFGGAVYVFRPKRGDLVKLLWWDGQGLVLYAKRLGAGPVYLPGGCGRRRGADPGAVVDAARRGGLAASEPVFAADIGLVKSTVSCGYRGYRNDCSGISGRVAGPRLAA